MGFNQQRFEATWQIVQGCGAFSAIVAPSPVLHFFDTLLSTNQTTWELVDQGAAAGTIVIAAQQTAGRGQWGRQWQSLPGGLYLSLALTPHLPIDQAAQLTLTSAWGIAIALRTIPPILSGVSSGIPVQIKWLNDLVLWGRKLGGILTETRLQSGVITKAVVGVGINWSNPVPDVGIQLQSFLEQHPDPLIESIELLAAIVAYGVFVGQEHLQQHGVEFVRSSYQSLLVNLGQSVVVDGRSGVVTGVSDRGELQVQVTSDESASAILVPPGTISLGYGSPV